MALVDCQLDKVAISDALPLESPSRTASVLGFKHEAGLAGTTTTGPAYQISTQSGNAGLSY